MVVVSCDQSPVQIIHFVISLDLKLMIVKVV